MTIEDKRNLTLSHFVLQTQIVGPTYTYSFFPPSNYLSCTFGTIEIANGQNKKIIDYALSIRNDEVVVAMGCRTYDREILCDSQTKLPITDETNLLTMPFNDFINYLETHDFVFM